MWYNCRYKTDFLNTGGYMSSTLAIKATKRDLEGAKPNALRAAGGVPAVIHDHGKQSHHIVLPEAELIKMYRSAGKHHTVEIDVEGKKFTALIKEVTHKPGSARLYHSVLQSVKANETVSAEIPLKLSEDIPAERANLSVVPGLTHVEVEAFPGDLVNSIEVDCSNLKESGDKLTVADLVAPKGMVIKTDPEQLVVHVETPKDQIAEADASAADLADDAGSIASAEEPATTEATEEE